MKGIDYSEGRPRPEAIVAEDFEFVMRYCPYAGYKKELTLEEKDSLLHVGLKIGMVFERNEERPLEGKSAGVTDAIVANRELARLGFPPNMPCFFASDVDVTAANIAAVVDYFRGACATFGLPRMGAYGDTDILRELKRLNLITYAWQSLGWNTGPVEGRNLVQYRSNVTLDGAAVDYNFTEGHDHSWLYGGDDMSSAEYDRLVKAVFGTEERLAALETAGVIPLEGRMDKHEQDQAAHSTSGGLENSEFLTRLAEAGEALRKAAGL